MTLDVANQCITFLNSRTRGIAGPREGFVRTLAASRNGIDRPCKYQGSYAAVAWLLHF